MNNYQLMLCYLKLLNQNLNMLHRDIISSNFFGNHEKLNEYYDKVQDWSDELSEVGRTLGYTEPSISEAIEKFKNVYDVISSSNDRGTKECFTFVQEWFNDLIILINKAKVEVKDFVANRLEEIQYYLNTEANYKLTHLLSEL